MARVAVNERVLRWALNRSALTESKLKARFPLTEWLSGQRKPTLRQLEAFATSTRTPLGYFFLSEPPVESLPIPHFRTLGDDIPQEHSPDLLETVQAIQMRQEWMRDYVVDQGQDPLPFVNSVRLDEKHYSVAKQIRDAMKLDNGWAEKCPTWKDALRYLREAIDDAGVFVVVNGVVGNNTHRKLDPNEFRGFVLVDEYAPFVFVNGADGKAAQMFTLAHELAHIFFGYSAAFDLHVLQPANDQIEKACSRVAAEFLVPESELRKIWPMAQNDDDPFQVVARRFKVSSLVAARRLLDVSLIPRETFFEFYDDYRNDERRKKQKNQGGGSFFLNQNSRVGQRFARAVTTALHEGAITYTEAYRLTGLHGIAFHKYAKVLKSGGVGQ